MEYNFAGRYFCEKKFSREDIFVGRYFRVNSIFAKISSRENNVLYRVFSIIISIFIVFINTFLNYMFYLSIAIMLFDRAYVI